MRKRQVGQAAPIGWLTLPQGIDYIRAHTGIRDVILSGGDPLLRTDEQVEWLLARLRAIAMWKPSASTAGCGPIISTRWIP